jgi:hypothetical protein
VAQGGAAAALSTRSIGERVATGIGSSPRREEDSVAFVFLQEFQASTDDRSTTNYDAVAARLDVASNPPDGLIVHTAGWDDQGIFRIVDVWDSREQAERFMTEQLQPALDEGMPDQANATPPSREAMYETHDAAKG